MKYSFLFLVLVSMSAFGQGKVVKKIEKELGIELVAIDPDYSIKIDSNTITNVWSRTMDSVKIGNFYKGEFIEPISSMERNSVLCPTYLSEDAVTKREFLDFRNWLRDSIARERIYFSLEDTQAANRYVQYQEKHFSPVLKKEVITKPHDRDYNRAIFALDWNVDLHYGDPSLVPILADLYLPQPERFRMKRTFDLRKYYANYTNNNGISSQVPILIDDYSLALNSMHDFDRRTVLSYLHDAVYLDAPITFIEPFMANAYCYWKSVQLNKEMKKSNFSITCRIPNAHEAETVQMTSEKSMGIESYNHTDNWRISNNEYRNFCNATLDSTLREYLFWNEVDNELVLTLINYYDIYFSERDLEFVELEISAREIIREEFSLSKDKINWKKFGYDNKEELVQQLRIDSLAYRYYWMDARNRSLNGELAIDETVQPSWKESGTLDLKLGTYDDHGDPIGKDFGMDGNTMNMSNSKVQWGYGTRSHENIQRFVMREVVVIPLPNTVPQNEEIAAITYKNALAYYNWKYRIDSYSEGEEGDWQKYVFPTEEEFERIKKGESIVNPAEEIELDSPVFRMVIELTPKN